MPVTVEEEEEEEFIQNRTRAGARFLTRWDLHAVAQRQEEFIASGNWRGKHNSLSRGAGADQP